jgi:hypothetical protein
MALASFAAPAGGLAGPTKASGPSLAGSWPLASKRVWDPPPWAWASNAVIGYLAGAPDADGVVRKLDRNRPVHDKATGNLDVLLGYNTRLFSNKVRTNFQLNIRNATESGRLQGVGVNPDGKFWQYRIIDPRQFIFTTSFDL